MIKLFLVISTLALTCQVPAQNAKRGKTALADHFESKELNDDDWSAIEFGKKENLRIVPNPVKSGEKVLRIALRKDDPESQYGNKRTELTFNNFPDPHKIDSTIQWYAFSNYFPADYANDPAEEIIAQWHDKSPHCSNSPTLAIEIKEDHFRAVIRYSTADYCEQPKSVVMKTFDLGEVPKNKWLDWKINYHPLTNENGVVKIWLNGQKILDYNGPCQYIGSAFPYFKIGLYKWCWMPEWKGIQSTQTERVYYLDDVIAGTSEAALKP